MLEALGGIEPLAGRVTSLVDNLSITLTASFPADSNVGHQLMVPTGTTVDIAFVSMKTDVGAEQARTASRVLGVAAFVGIALSVGLALRLLFARGNEP